LDENESASVNQFKQSSHVTGSSSGHKSAKHHGQSSKSGEHRPLSELSSEGVQSEQMRLEDSGKVSSLENGYALHGRGARSNLTRIENANLLVLDSREFTIDFKIHHNSNTIV
jgi:hypothetical protein